MKLTKRTFVAAVTATLMALPAGWAAAQDRLTVIATTGMIADAAANVGGDLVEVTSLMGEGVDPHSYRQTRTDIVALANADLVLWNGLFLEAQMEEFMLGLSEGGTVVAVAESIPDSLLLSSQDYEGRTDPHVWMNVNLWSNVVVTIRNALIEADPDNAATYEANADTYLAELGELAQYVVQVLSTVPAESRVVVSAHDAFNYFGNAYGFEPVGIQGLSTESEAGLQEIAAMVDFLVERNIGAVFVESSVSERNIQAVIEGAAARGHEIVVGGELFSDAMGQPDTYRGTYIGMLDHNATTIATALGGEAPNGGMNGLLVDG
ncbi:Manganese ABC transporter, periplasmic-binding protein SitA [Roseibacterium elongatum DSM 19469]|uniref:Manganese ABC transporter, periplasmic-binding protein SitA n=1 Tax=Roseicyclus elongatus DSM 19469 TaxID=1294273 RepID=W8SPN8_9RHOB|nr:zinc ABC transporter substrate-binding protein [Roseibacterium elongatum]AHM04470.1 Manganese ABC transporter, periplasmic-binding protein SitA [Roseibacterium elongatum DSM 19469]